MRYWGKKVRKIQEISDKNGSPSPIFFTVEKFEELVKASLKTIPEEFLSKLDNIEICVENRPSSDLLHKFKGRKLFGVYQGTPQVLKNRSVFSYPARISLFINRVLDLDEFKDRKEMNKPFPEGDFIYSECEERINKMLEIRES
ncbi:MAG: hypothetical protein QMD71_07705 [bacterium]|nr:hypothetical protein [bacterium]